MTKRKSRYPDELNKPIRIPRWTGDVDDPVWRDELKRRRHKKALAYFKRLGINPDSPDRWEELLFALGEGFRVAESWRPRGAPRKLSPLELLGLLMYVDNCKRKGVAKTEKAALRKYLKDWYNKNGKRQPSEKTLNTEAGDMQKKLSRMRRLRDEGMVGLSPFFK